MIWFPCVVAISALLFKTQYNLLRQLYFSFFISGPPALPFIGNGLQYINKSSSGVTCYFFQKFAISYPIFVSICQDLGIFFYTVHKMRELNQIIAFPIGIFTLLNTHIKKYGEFIRLWRGTELIVLITGYFYFY